MKNNPLVNVLGHVNKSPEQSARKLTRKFGTNTQIYESDMLALSDALEGDNATALYIKLVCAIVSRRGCDLFKFGKKYTDEDIEKYLVFLCFGLSVETVYVLPVKAGKIVACERAGEGTVNTSSILPRKLLEIAKRHGADSVIISHNHPRGYAIPSEDDKSATRILNEFFVSSGIKLLAHYVVSGVSCRKIDFGM